MSTTEFEFFEGSATIHSTTSQATVRRSGSWSSPRPPSSCSARASSRYRSATTRRPGLPLYLVPDAGRNLTGGLVLDWQEGKDTVVSVFASASLSMFF